MAYEALRGYVDADGALGLFSLDDDLCKAVEGGDTEGAGVGCSGGVLLTVEGGVAIAYADDAGTTFESDVDGNAGCGDAAALLVEHFDGQDADVATVGLDGCALSREAQQGRFASRRYGLCKDLLACLVAHSLEGAGSVGCCPGEVTVVGHRLAALGASVDEEFDLVAVAVGPDVDRLALMALEVPVGEDVEHGVRGPPGAEIIGLVLFEAAVVEQTEFGVDGGEGERVGFALVVEARPVEAAEEPGALIVEPPATLDDVGVRSVGAVHGGHVAVVAVVEVYASCAAGRRLFATVGYAFGEALTLALDVVLHDVVVAGHVDGTRDGGAARGGDGSGTRGVEEMHVVRHGACYAFAEVLPFDAPFLVADTPHDDGGVVAVATNHVGELLLMIVVDAREAVLLNDENAHAVAGVNHGGRHGVVR